MEELESHGYVAVSIAHAWETPFFITRDNGIRAFDPRNDEFRLRSEERVRALNLQRRMVMTHDQIGAMGHSFGGTASHEACLSDPRCKAGVNMDGVRFSGNLERNLTRPFMFFHHDNPAADNKTPNRLYFERAEDAAYLLMVRGARQA